MAQRISICFDDGWRLEARGEYHVHRGKLAANRTQWVQQGDILYLNLEWGEMSFPDRAMGWSVEPGEYVVCQGGLYARVTAPV